MTELQRARTDFRYEKDRVEGDINLLRANVRDGTRVGRLDLSPENIEELAHNFDRILSRSIPEHLNGDAVTDDEDDPANPTRTRPFNIRRDLLATWLQTENLNIVSSGVNGGVVDTEILTSAGAVQNLLIKYSLNIAHPIEAANEMIYEDYIGREINILRVYCPNFMLTYGLITCNPEVNLTYDPTIGKNKITTFGRLCTGGPGMGTSTATRDGTTTVTDLGEQKFVLIEKTPGRPLYDMILEWIGARHVSGDPRDPNDPPVYLNMTNASVRAAMWDIAQIDVQCFSALKIARDVLGLIHRDCHGNNIMATPIDVAKGAGAINYARIINGTDATKNVFIYVFEDGTYVAVKADYVITFIDFGRSSTNRSRTAGLTNPHAVEWNTIGDEGYGTYPGRNEADDRAMLRYFPTVLDNSLVARTSGGPALEALRGMGAIDQYRGVIISRGNRSHNNYTNITPNTQRMLKTIADRSLAADNVYGNLELVWSYDFTVIPPKPANSVFRALSSHVTSIRTSFANSAPDVIDMSDYTDASVYVFGKAPSPMTPGTNLTLAEIGANTNNCINTGRVAAWVVATLTAGTNNPEIALYEARVGTTQNVEVNMRERANDPVSRRESRLSRRRAELDIANTESRRARRSGNPPPTELVMPETQTGGTCRLRHVSYTRGDVDAMIAVARNMAKPDLLYTLPNGDVVDLIGGVGQTIIDTHLCESMAGTLLTSNPSIDITFGDGETTFLTLEDMRYLMANMSQSISFIRIIDAINPGYVYTFEDCATIIYTIYNIDLDDALNQIEYAGRVLGGMYTRIAGRRIRATEALRRTGISPDSIYHILNNYGDRWVDSLIIPGLTDTPKMELQETLVLYLNNGIDRVGFRAWTIDNGLRQEGEIIDVIYDYVDAIVGNVEGNLLARRLSKRDLYVIVSLLNEYIDFIV